MSEAKQRALLVGLVVFWLGIAVYVLVDDHLARRAGRGRWAERPAPAEVDEVSGVKLVERGG